MPVKKRWTRNDPQWRCIDEGWSGFADAENRWLDAGSAMISRTLRPLMRYSGYFDPPSKIWRVFVDPSLCRGSKHTMCRFSSMNKGRIAQPDRCVYFTMECHRPTMVAMTPRQFGIDMAHAIVLLLRDIAPRYKCNAAALDKVVAKLPPPPKKTAFIGLLDGPEVKNEPDDEPLYAYEVHITVPLASRFAKDEAERDEIDAMDLALDTAMDKCGQGTLDAREIGRKEVEWVLPAHNAKAVIAAARKALRGFAVPKGATVQVMRMKTETLSRPMRF